MNIGIQKSLQDYTDHQSELCWNWEQIACCSWKIPQNFLYCHNLNRILNLYRICCHSNDLGRDYLDSHDCLYVNNGLDDLVSCHDLENHDLFLDRDNENLCDHVNHDNDLYHQIFYPEDIPDLCLCLCHSHVHILVSFLFSFIIVEYNAGVKDYLYLETGSASSLLRALTGSKVNLSGHSAAMCPSFPQIKHPFAFLSHLFARCPGTPHLKQTAPLNPDHQRSILPSYQNRLYPSLYNRRQHVPIFHI